MKYSYQYVDSESNCEENIRQYNLRHNLQFKCSGHFKNINARKEKNFRQTDTQENFIYYHYLVFFCRAPLAAYGSSQARSRIRAAAASLHQSCSCQPTPEPQPQATWNLSRVCDLHHSSWQRWILDPLSEAGDRTYILMDTSQIYFHCTITGTPWFLDFKRFFSLHCSKFDNTKTA